jgi:hypothetical protein
LADDVPLLFINYEFNDNIAQHKYFSIKQNQAEKYSNFITTRFVVFMIKQFSWAALS